MSNNNLHTLLTNVNAYPNYVTDFDVRSNPNQHCISSPDPTHFDTLWTYTNRNINSCVSFSSDCYIEIEGCMDGTDINYNPLATIQDYTYFVSSNNELNTENILLKTTNILVEETNFKKKNPLFYIYDNGT